MILKVLMHLFSFLSSQPFTLTFNMSFVRKKLQNCCTKMSKSFEIERPKHTFVKEEKHKIQCTKNMYRCTDCQL